MKKAMFAFFLSAISWVHGQSASEIQTVYRNLDNDQVFIPFDFDDDGDIDLIASNISHFTYSPQTSILYVNDGAGKFTGPRVFAHHGGNTGNQTSFGRRHPGDPISMHRAIVASEVGQTQPNYYEKFPVQDTRFLSTGTRGEDIGVFGTAQTSSDLDGDGYLDLLKHQTDHLSVSWGNSDGSYHSISDGSVDYSFIIARSDFDGDGRLDILFNGEINGTEGFILLKQLANRSFAAPEILRLMDGTVLPQSSYQFYDLNGDNHLDLLKAGTNTTTHYLQTNSGRFSPATDVTHDVKVSSIVAVETSANNPSFIIFRSEDANNNPLLLKVRYDLPNSTLVANFSHIFPNTPIPANVSFFDYHATADFNGDGLQDIAISLPIQSQWEDHYYLSNLQLCIGIKQANGSYSFTLQGSPPIYRDFIQQGNFEGNATMEFLAAEATTGNFTIISYNDAQGWSRTQENINLVPPAQQNTDIFPRDILPADINADRLDDLIIWLERPPTTPTDNATHYTAIAINQGNSQFAYTSALPVAFLNGQLDHPNKATHFADWNGDGTNDIITQDIGWRTITNGIVSDAVNPIVQPGTQIGLSGMPETIHGKMHIRDIDGDGRLDLFVPYTGHHAPPDPNIVSKASIVFGGPQGTVDQTVQLPITLIAADELGNSLPLDATVIDLNNDGLLDIVYEQTIPTAFPPNNIAYHVTYNSQDGRFLNSTSTGPVSSVHGIILADYNGDGNGSLCSITDYSDFSASGISSQSAFEPSDIYTSSLQLIEMFDIDDDHDADFFFQTTNNYTAAIYCLRNPSVNGNDPVVRYALEAGLRAENTLPSADPEGDHINNLEEFMFGGSPNTTDPTGILPQLRVTQTTNSSPHLTARFNKRINLPQGRQYIVKISSDLLTWHEIPHSSAAITPIDATWDHIEFSIDPADYFTPPTKSFIHWEVK